MMNLNKKYLRLGLGVTADAIIIIIAWILPFGITILAIYILIREWLRFKK